MLIAGYRNGRNMAKERTNQMHLNESFNRFDQTMKHLIQVPHSKIKAKLDAEKAAKVNRRNRTIKGSSNSEKDKE